MSFVPTDMLAATKYIHRYVLNMYVESSMRFVVPLFQRVKNFDGDVTT